jgi:signal transduction histidine kinase
MNEMFVGILGHDLRTPLSSIMTGAQLLERQVTDPGQLKTLRRMLSSSGRMRDMIDQLLDLTRARLANGAGMAPEREPIDIGELVTRAVEELRPTAADRRLAIDVTGDGRCVGDATRLLQVFSNLLSNAIHHGTAGTPISVAVEAGDEDASEIRVVVRNEGAIPAELLPRIFDPFRGGRTSTGSRGLGLGLFITQQVVEAHGGRITVTSSPSAGTAFTVTLPRRAEMARPRAREAFR